MEEKRKLEDKLTIKGGILYLEIKKFGVKNKKHIIVKKKWIIIDLKEIYRYILSRRIG